ncbi:major facilitator superfamily domain-containing protein [Xylariomycetidae sp. FL0641]|nr:major facilitator superfamily domain-containing protein [Xylariomycetidae sp. FL0641]
MVNPLRNKEIAVLCQLRSPKQHGQLLDATILAPVLPELAIALNGSAVETFWTGTSYLLSYAVFLPFIGAGSSIFGRKPAVLFSLLMFTLGTIVCCTADRFPQLLAGRTIQGIGGGGIFVLGSIIIADIVSISIP